MAAENGITLEKFEEAPPRVSELSALSGYFSDGKLSCSVW